VISSKLGIQSERRSTAWFAKLAQQAVPATFTTDQKPVFLGIHCGFRNRYTIERLRHWDVQLF